MSISNSGGPLPDRKEDSMLESLAPVDNSTLRERVYRTPKQAILEGRFSPGEALPTRSLAKVLGTSVMPVRDALLRLHAEGGLDSYQIAPRACRHCLAR